MREGSLDAPTRHTLDWQNPDFTDPAKLDAELRRVFDICHGCRRCFNLCNSFPRLFDLIDAAPSGELDTVASADFKPVVDACTLCDMCFMTKCPYVPPHEFNLDFPHLMLRARAAEAKRKGPGFFAKQLTETDRNGKICSHISGLANWATDTGNTASRVALEKIAQVDRKAALPRYQSRTAVEDAQTEAFALNTAAPSFGKRKVVLYATCFANYNNPQIARAMRAILAKNGVAHELVYPECCGMPQLEQGDIARVAESAARVAAALAPKIAQGYDVVALVPSCALMLKFEWPLIAPQDENVKKLARSTFDASEYIVAIAGKEGLAPGLAKLDGGVALHIACHARAQNMGQKAAEMMRLIPNTELTVIERCSGHGGSWGIMKGNFETALKVGKPVAQQAARANRKHVASECPLAGMHVLQGMDRAAGAIPAGEAKPIVPKAAPHPIELFARAYGLDPAAA